MTSKLPALIGAVVVIGIGSLLWPIFAVGEPWLIWALSLFILGGAVLVGGALRSNRRIFRYALAGIPAGFVLGGLSLFLLVRTGSNGAAGWDDLVAVIAGILGAFVGSVLGGAIGGAWGASRDRAAVRS